MTSVTVGDIFEDNRTVAGNCVGFGVGDCGFDCEDVHSVYFETRDVLATLVVIGKSGGAVGCRTHTVFVVYKLALNATLGGINLLSQPKRTGRFHNLAMLKASNT